MLGNERRIADRQTSISATTVTVTLRPDESFSVTQANVDGEVV